MSFYSAENQGSCMCPGAVSDAQGVRERVCVQVKKVYDSCMQQEQLDNVTICVHDLFPCDTDFTYPLTFISCRSTGCAGKLHHLCIDRMDERPNFARVRADVELPLEILFEDAEGNEGLGYGCITVHKDVILYVPCDSIVPFTAEAAASAVCVTGSFIEGDRFRISLCVTIILKIVADVQLMIPSYGYCAIPPCEEFSAGVCSDFFNLPVFPVGSSCAANGAAVPGSSAECRCPN